MLGLTAIENRIREVQVYIARSLRPGRGDQVTKISGFKMGHSARHPL